MIKSKKQMYLVIAVFAIILMLTTVTYAFFNYTRTGVSNTIRVGRISFITRQNGNINLYNVFPIETSEATGENSNYDEVAIEIVGDTDYTGGIEYVVTATNVNLSVGTKEIPITLEVDVDGLGTEETGDYYTNRENYSVSKYKIEYNGTIEEESHLLVGYIAPNTTGNIDGINGTINIKAYLDKDKIKISDTYDGNETDNMGTTNEWVNGRVVLTTNEWNSLQNSGLSFKVKVEANEGIWVKELVNFAETIKRKSSTVDYIASYDDIITQNPTFTTQDQVQNSATKQTVYYYTGSNAATNANVLFAGYCWQIIRTTDNGGVRLLYNGLAKTGIVLTTELLSDTDIMYTNDETYAFNYNTNSKKWSSSNNSYNTKGTFVFSVKEAGDYAINYNISTQQSNNVLNIYKNSSLIKSDYGTNDYSLDLGTLATDDEIKIEFNLQYYYTNINNNKLVFDIGKIINRKDSDYPLCNTDRLSSKGIVGTTYGTTYLSDIYGRIPATAFGRSFDYDLETGIFTLKDGEGLPDTWTESDTNNNGIQDYDDLIGTYTCGSDATTCSELYYIAQYYDFSRAYLIKYTISDGIHYSILGTTPYNQYDDSISKVGYMFNKSYTKLYGKKTGEYYTTAIWENGAYVLSNGNNGTAPDVTHHYICDTDCTKVRYYYHSTDYYILLENGITAEDVLYRMTGTGSSDIKTKNASYNLNEKNSAIKGYVDSWYQKYLTAYTSYLDRTAVYCNDRSISDLGGWNPSGTSLTEDLQFNQYNVNRDLNCVNESDRFAVSNTKAQLIYPIGLLTEPERGLMTESYAITHEQYWTGTPQQYNFSGASVRTIYIIGNYSQSNVLNVYGVRPVITLKPSTKLESGTGTYTDPYIVGPIVERDN